MLKIKVESSNIEKALKNLKRKVIKTKQTKNLRENKEYKKPSLLKRAKIEKAKYVQSKKDSENR